MDAEKRNLGREGPTQREKTKGKKRRKQEDDMGSEQRFADACPEGLRDAAAAWVRGGMGGGFWT